MGITSAETQGLTKLSLIAAGTVPWFVRAQRRGYGHGLRARATGAGWGRGMGAAWRQGLLLTLSRVGVMAAYGQTRYWLTWAMLPQN